jgi:hypothetical protein
MTEVSDVTACHHITEVPDECGKCGGTDLRWVAAVYARDNELSPELRLYCSRCDAVAKIVECVDVAEFLNERRTAAKAALVTASKFVPFRVRLIHHQRFQAGGTAFTLQAGTIVTVRQHDRANGKVLVDFGDCLVDWISQVTLQSCFNRVVDDE